MNLTPTVQVAPGARVVPVQLSPPTTALKNQVVAVPPVIATAVTLTGDVVDVFVRVTVPVPVTLRIPFGKVMVNGLGVIVTVPGGGGAIPVPLRATGDPVTGTLPAMVRVALTRPVAVGVKTTVMVQLDPAAKVVVQVPPDRE